MKPQNTFSRHTLLSVLIEDLFELAVINIVFVVTIIPIVTIGPATAAMTKCIILLLDGEDIRPVKYYLKYFRSFFKPAFFVGLLNVITNVIVGYSLYFYTQCTQINGIFYALVFLCAVSLFLIYIVSIYLYPIFVIVEQPLSAMLKNSLIISIAFLKRTLVVIFIHIVLATAVIVFLPYSIPVIVLLFFSLCSVASSFAAVKPIKAVIVKD